MPNKPLLHLGWEASSKIDEAELGNMFTVDARSCEPILWPHGATDMLVVQVTGDFTGGVENDSGAT